MKPLKPDADPDGDHRFQVRFLWGSVALSGLLLILLVWPVRQGPSVGRSHLAEGVGAGVPPATSGPRAEGIVSFNTAPYPASIWSRLVSTNLEAYAANLRRVGCPEETICDVLAPRIRQTFDELTRRTPFQGDFWAVGDERRRVRQKERDDRLVLVAERDRLLNTLGCPAMSWDSLPGLEVRMGIALALGFLTPEAQEQLIGLAMGLDARGSVHADRFGGILLPEDVEVIRGERDRYRKQLEALISLEQQEEFALRLQFLDGSGRSSRGVAVASLGMTPGELREFHRIHASSESSPFDQLGGFDLLLGEERSSKVDADVNAEIRTLLGEKRYAAYHQQEDPAFQTATEVVKEFAQSPELPGRVHEVVEQLRAEIPGLRDQWAIDRDVGRLQLMERREAFQLQLSELLAGVPEERRREMVQEWIDGAIRTQWKHR